MPRRIAVTGGSGKAGRAVVNGLREHGFQVLNIDLATSPESYHVPDGAPVPLIGADLTDLGQTIESLSGGEAVPPVDAVVHLAAIASPYVAAQSRIFDVNVRSTYNVFAAAWRLGLDRVVWASSETVMGLPYETPPDHVPVDEAIVRPESNYALAKDLGEEMARQLSRRSGIPILGLRLSNVMVRSDYERFEGWQNDPHARKFNLWGYVDETHVVDAVTRALEVDIAGADAFVIAAADTVMRRPSRELMAEVFPGVPIAEHVSGNDTLLDISHARSVLGYDPTFSWRDL